DKRAYPEETIFVVRVSPDDHSAAQNIGNLLDRELAKSDFKGFVTVRRQEPDASSTDVLPKGIACGRPIATTINPSPPIGWRKRPNLPRPTRSGWRTSPTSRPRKAGFIWPPCWTSTAARSW